MLRAPVVIDPLLVPVDPPAVVPLAVVPLAVVPLPVAPPVAAPPVVLADPAPFGSVPVTSIVCPT
jgi:hypothetical protein